MDKLPEMPSLQISLPATAIMLGMAICFIALAPPLACACHPGSVVPDTGWVVWLHKGRTPEDVVGAQGDLAAWKTLGFDLYRVRIPASRTREMPQYLVTHPAVKYAGPDRPVSLRGTRPDDPLYGDQWHHALLGSERAWDVTAGGMSPGGHPIVIAVMDAGFEAGHEDLSPNLWTNPDEIPGDGIDNDNNGFTDDHSTYNPKLDNGDIPIHAHGQSVAGYIGARGNNGIGISGISWQIGLMLVAPTLVESDVIAGLRYVHDWRRRFNETRGAEGAYVAGINMSLGFDSVFPADLPWMCPLLDSLHQQGVLVVAAGPNEGVDIGNVGDLPCLCPSSNLLCVTNTTQDDEIVSNAGFSKEFVHLAAPGFQSFTTRLSTSGTYGIFSGTSAAAPMVTGAIGLLAAMPCDEVRDLLFDDPAQAASILRTAILEGVEPVKDLRDLTVTGGRLSLWSKKGFGAVPSYSGRCGSPEGPLAILGMEPNPAYGQVLIRLRSPGTIPVPVRVFNLLGQVLWEMTYLPESFASKYVEIPVNDWPAGMYIVRAGDGKQASTGKLMVHH